MYAASDIARWFLAKNNQKRIENEQDNYEVYDGITHLKLQKLLYFAQGIHLALYKTPLFSNDILAWEHGPVVQDVYDIYKPVGRNPISYEREECDVPVLNAIECDEHAKTALELTYDNFSIYTAWQLREMTHTVGAPWDTIVKSQGKNAVIPTTLIQNYFEKEVVDDAED